MSSNSIALVFLVQQVFYSPDNADKMRQGELLNGQGNQPRGRRQRDMATREEESSLPARQKNCKWSEMVGVHRLDSRLDQHAAGRNNEVAVRLSLLWCLWTRPAVLWCVWCGKPTFLLHQRDAALTTEFLRYSTRPGKSRSSVNPHQTKNPNLNFFSAAVWPDPDFEDK